jgi:hypothetical protein
MVSSGTGSVGFEATSAMFAVCDGVSGWCYGVVEDIGCVLQTARLAIIWRCGRGDGWMSKVSLLLLDAGVKLIWEVAGLRR